jgi:glycosyltransferase A (GT-A) superfamily protein (DUF2064 family)
MGGLKNRLEKNSQKYLLIFFAKNPLAGGVKTRLGKKIGPEKASLIYKAMLEFLFDYHLFNNEYSVKIYISPGKTSVSEKLNPGTENSNQKIIVREFIDELFGSRNSDSSYQLKVREIVNLQAGQDLGEKMAAALLTESSSFDKIVLAGTDFLFLNKSFLMGIFRKILDNNHFCLGPCLDGGYYLIGINSKKIFKDFPLWNEYCGFLKRINSENHDQVSLSEYQSENGFPANHSSNAKSEEYLFGKIVESIFGGISWSTSTVFEEQIKRIDKLNLSYSILPEGEDIDDESSLYNFIDTKIVENYFYKANLAGTDESNFLENLIKFQNKISKITQKGDLCN